MTRIYYIILCLLVTANINGQNLDEFLKLVEDNSPALRSFKKFTETKIQNTKTGLNPDDPEIEAGFLKGNNSDAGNMTNFKIKQRFDFPTTYLNRRKVSKINKEIFDIEYQKVRQKTLLQAKKLYIEIVFLQKLKSKIEMRIENVEKIREAFKRKLDIGEVNIIEFNKVELESSVLKNKEIDHNLELKLKLSEAKLLCGTDIEASNGFNTDTKETVDELINKYLTNSPEIKLNEMKILSAQKNTKLVKSERLPTFSLGYESESTPDVTYQGPTAGISIPLWKNRNKVRSARLLEEYTKSALNETQLRIRLRVEALYKNIENYRKTLDTQKSVNQIEDNLKLLTKSFESGNISVVEFFNQLEVFYQIEEQILDMEKNLHIRNAELYRVNL